ncbi:MAG: ABC transporter substrate-binding protein [Acidimicrobiales bacterium]
MALVLASGACTGNHSVSKANRGPGTVSAGSSETTLPGTPSTVAGAKPAEPSTKGGPNPGAPSSPGEAAATGTPLPAAPPPGSPEQTSTGFSYKVANLYPAAQDRIGITANQITLCIHAPLVLGPAFNDSQTDFKVFWQWLADHGGIYKRSVKMIFTDDAYTPQGGVQAAQQCAQSNPFFMTAGVGFDTVPAVRSWAEQNKLLYLSSFATETGLAGLKYTFQMQPSVEQFGQVAGDYVGAKYPGKVGVVWRNSPNWQGGRDHFESAAKAKGSKVVADVPVQENQGDYSAAILQLQQTGAQTVLAWMNVLEFAQLEKQAAAQGYHPRWVTATFNLVTDTLGHDVDGTTSPAAVGLWVSPEFHNGDTTSPWSGEERAMEAAYAKYDPKHTVTDTDWQVWLGFKDLALTLTDCGVDCSRNKLAGMFLGGYKQQLPPLCALDFARGKGRIGSFQFNVMEGTNRGGKAGWKQVATCAETF